MKKDGKKGFTAEFKEFITRGNVVDMAVGVIVGSAFTAIVTSLVDNIFNPVIGYFIGGVNFTDLSITLPRMIPGADPGHRQLRSFHTAGSQFPDHRIRRLLHGQTDQSTA